MEAHNASRNGAARRLRRDELNGQPRGRSAVYKDRWSAENDEGEVLKNRWALLDFADAARYRTCK
jgi:hypothetical protein